MKSDAKAKDNASKPVIVTVSTAGLKKNGRAGLTLRENIKKSKRPDRYKSFTFINKCDIIYTTAVLGPQSLIKNYQNNIF